VLSLGAGGIPFVVLVVIFRAVYGLRSEYVDTQFSPTALSRLLEVPRYKALLVAFGQHVLMFGHWAVIASPLVLLVYVLWMGATNSAILRGAVSGEGLTLVADMCG